MNLPELNEAQLRAYETIKRAIEVDSLLPGNVFVGPWHSFRMFESDRIFDASFIDLVKHLLSVEAASLACLINLDRSHDLQGVQIDVSFIGHQTTSDEYELSLRRDGPQNGWLYDVDRYACSSEVGGWCIYCEKSNDVAVIGLRNSPNAEELESVLGAFDALPIQDLVLDGRAARFPFDRMISEWRTGLIQHYGSATTRR